MITVEIVDEQRALPIDRERIRLAVENVLTEAKRARAAITVALVDDEAIHQLNRQFLEHDCPTDVISFLLEDDEENGLEGELAISTDTAIVQAEEFGLAAVDELLLYVVHGTLHLVGYDDLADADRLEMRRQETIQMNRLGVQLPAADRVTGIRPAAIYAGPLPTDEGSEPG